MSARLTRGVSPSEQWAALGRLALVVGGGVFAAVLTGTVKTVAVVAAVVLMIMLHELGHFATAKWSGMKVTEYFLGFGPRLWSVRRGETEYGVKAIPAGGYVKIVGMNNMEEVDPADEARTYRQSTFPRRLLVVSAGSAMHFLLAFLLLWGMLSFVGTVEGDHPLLTVGSISTLATGPSPAQKAGFRAGDRIVAVDGKPLKKWDELPPMIQARPGQPVRFTVLRHGATLTLTAVPVDLQKVKVTGGGAPVPSTAKPYGFVGIGPAYPVDRKNPAAAVPAAAVDVGKYTWTVVGALGHIFSPHGLSSYGEQLTGHAPSGPSASTDQQNRFVSPVGLVRLASDAASSGVRDVLVLLVAINVFVGVFNMVPLLPLDGGHVAVAIYERARSRRGRRYRVDIRKLMPATYLVFFLIVLLGVSALYLDIVKPFPNPFQ
ncbi:MAG TPA: site-2 protease family protein [Acidimicrobiales bacterium]|nr:site-2 protease family protein [Acidimicrobiales bacterium]